MGSEPHDVRAAELLGVESDAELGLQLLTVPGVGLDELLVCLTEATT
jgi:hypothetical protein